jgi:mRNA interferase RelE/StbE
MYKVQLRRKVQRSLDNLPEHDFDAIISALKALEGSPRPKGVEKIKSAGLWRVRHGDYRIIYSIDDKQKTVAVVRIGHRREVYRGL